MTDEAASTADLERRVRDLEATVQGLTEELVEANERLRALEQAEPGEPTSKSSADVATAVIHGEATKQEREAIVAERAAEATKSAQSEKAPEDEEASELDDIIVA
ncbi:MAG TPA: hypothetical protein VKA37_12200 [Halobacteriales archaeon]|nr:hypothetical protein [Halobacteriales archaeon]